MAARAAVDRRIADSQLEIGRLTAERDYDQAQVELTEVHAERGGTLVHAFDSLSDAGGRIDEGASCYPGQKIGEVVDTGSLAVRAYALEPDRVGLAPEQIVGLVFDALPVRHVRGRITAISGAPEPKAEWGDGRYFLIDIALPAELRLSLRPGMSVRVETPTVAAGAPSRAVAP